MGTLIRIIVGTVVAAALLLPLLALVGSGLVAFDPVEGARPTLVPWGLLLSDPFVGACLWNSVTTATIAVVVGGFLGVPLARIAMGREPRFRRALLAMAVIPAGCGPFFGAIGLAALRDFGGDRLPAGDAWAWVALGWSQAAFAAGWLAFWTSRALGAVPADAVLLAEQAGAPRGAVWRSGAWPLIRPSVARAAAGLFAVLLLEPGGPLVLGLRRTLAAQVVEAAFRADPASRSRAATLALLGSLVAMVVGFVVRRSGGEERLGRVATAEAGGSGRTRRDGGRWRAVAELSAGGLLAILALAPLLGIAGLAIDQLRDDPAGVVPALAGLAGTLRGPGPLASTLAIAASVALAGPIVTRAATFAPCRWSAAAAGAVAPLAIGLGVLCLGWFGEGPSTGGGTRLGPLSGFAAIDPIRSPLVLVAWATLVAQVAWLDRLRGTADRGPTADLIELSRLLGRRWGWRAGLRRLPVAVAAALGPGLYGAAGLATAVLLTPTDVGRPIAPALFRMLIDGRAGAEATLALLAGVLLQTAGFAILAGSGRGRPSTAVGRC